MTGAVWTPHTSSLLIQPGYSTKTSITKRKHYLLNIIYEGISPLFSFVACSHKRHKMAFFHRFDPEMNQYQLQCFGFAAILVTQPLVQFGFSKMAACWLLPFNLLGNNQSDP